MKLNNKNRITENFSGRYGDAIFYPYRNLTCVRQMPKEMPAPTSPGQLAQQERIASIGILYRAMKEAGLYPYWQKAAEGLTWNGYNLLVKANLPAFGHDGTICDFSKIQLSAGKVALPDNLRQEKDADGNRVVKWDNNPLKTNARDDDRVWLAAMKDRETFDIQLLDTDEACRRDGRVLVRLPEILKNYLHLYVAFCSPANGECSASRYFFYF